MPDERTSTLNLPLPHPSHLLSDDVQRLRDALTVIDDALAQQSAQTDATFDEIETLALAGL